MVKNKYIDFDIIGFLDEYSISHAEGVENVGGDWIGIETCPFCDAGLFHFAINRHTKKASCWVCGESCNPIRLIVELLNIDYPKAYEIISKFSTEIVEYKVRKPSKDIIWPSHMTELDKTGIKYLKGRKYNPEMLIQEYKIKQTGFLSYLKVGDTKQDFRFRIIVPIIMNHEIVSYLGRDMTEKHKNRYQNPVIEACKITPSSAIYNIDTVKDQCIIVEGVTDVWRMGKEVISLQGVKYTLKQIRFIAEKKLKKVFIMYDINAEKEALKLANSLSGVCGEVSIIDLNSADDPGKLTDFEALKIKHQLLGG